MSDIFMPNSDLMFPVEAGIPSDYIAHWTMDNISGSTLVDESANGNDGTIVGATQTTGNGGHIDEALSFAGGSNQYVEIAMTIPSTVTIAGWVKVTNVSANRSIFSIGSGTNPSRVFLTAAGPTLYISTNSGAAGFDSVSWSSSGAFVHLRAAWDGSTMNLYLGNTLVATATQTAAFNDTTKLLLGTRRDTDYIDCLLGLMDHVYVYNRLLTTDEGAALAGE